MVVAVLLIATLRIVRVNDAKGFAFQRGPQLGQDAVQSACQSSGLNGHAVVSCLYQYPGEAARQRLLVQATLDMGAIILTIAGLSFIGFGAQPPTPEWGVMVSEGRTFLQTQWWIPTAPALAILFLVMRHHPGANFGTPETVCGMSLAWRFY